MLVITITLIVVSAVLLLIYWSFFPKEKIYYFLKKGNKPEGVISIIGEETDSSWWKLIFRPLENVNPFEFTFKKIMPLSEAKARAEKTNKQTFSILHEIDGTECVVERTEFVPGFLAQELHPIYIRFDSLEPNQGATDMILILQVAYKPLGNEGALAMVTKTENWLTFAETTIAEFFSIFCRKKSFDDLRKISLDEIIEKADHTDHIRDNINTKEKLYEYFNALFKKYGFEVTFMTLKEINYGPDSKDVFEDQEKIAKEERAFQKQLVTNRITDAAKDNARQNRTKDWVADKKIIEEKAEITKGLVVNLGDAMKNANSGLLGSNPNITHAVINGAGLEKNAELFNTLITANDFSKEPKPKDVPREKEPDETKEKELENKDSKPNSKKGGKNG